MLELDTPQGPARAHLRPACDARGALVLGHGAGGGVDAPDLVLATEVANGLGITVALVEQPYRVARRWTRPPISSTRRGSPSSSSFVPGRSRASRS